MHQSIRGHSSTPVVIRTPPHHWTISTRRSSSNTTRSFPTSQRYSYRFSLTFGLNWPIGVNPSSPVLPAQFWHSSQGCARKWRGRTKNGPSSVSSISTISFSTNSKISSQGKSRSSSPLRMIRPPPSLTWMSRRPSYCCRTSRI